MFFLHKQMPFYLDERQLRYKHCKSAMTVFVEIEPVIFVNFMTIIIMLHGLIYTVVVIVIQLWSVLNCCGQCYTVVVIVKRLW